MSVNPWKLPVTAEIGGKEYPIRADFRDIFEVLRFLTSPDYPNYARWPLAIGYFFEGTIPEEHQKEALDYLSEFIAYGALDARPGPKLLDWEQDAQIIVADINKVAGKEIRAENFIHWWTFLSYFYGIGEGQLSTVVSIRAKKAKGKKLEKWEQEYYRENRKKIDFRTPDTKENEAIREYFNKWL